MRQDLKARDIIAIVKDTKPLTHEKYFLYSATCLRCEQTPQAVTYKGTYYRQSVGVPAKTFVIRQHGVHEHDLNAEADQASTCSPLHNAAANAYLATAGPHTKKGLTSYLQAAGFALRALPEASKLSRWLQNHKPKSTERTSADPPPPRVCLVQRSLDQWPKSEPSSCSDIFVLQNPPPKLDSTRVCMAFSCKGMCDVMRRYTDADVAMLIDLKQSCMEHGWGVITASFLVKDRLRWSTLMRKAKRRIHGYVYTSHAAPILQAVLDVDQLDNIVQVLIALEREWARVRPNDPPLHDVLIQVHKDYHPALENARNRCIKGTRPVNDFFHFVDKGPTIESKLHEVVLQGAKFIKKEYGWAMASLMSLRHIPNIDL